MHDESHERLIMEYRAAALEEPSASLDRAILALARRRAARARTVRRGFALCALLALAVVLASLAQRPGAIRTRSGTAGGNYYGLQVGATRSYLLTVSSIPPGVIDWR